MLVGHFAMAFVGKRIDAAISLGTLALAAMLPDILWPVFSIAGIEYTTDQTGSPATALDIGYSHSLLMVAIWATLFAAAYFFVRRSWRGTWILFGAVLSHWALDSISHRHALTPDSHSYYGLGLWGSLPATIIVEGGFWVLAILFYLRATTSSGRAGKYGFWAVVILLTFIWITNIKKGPPPPKAVIGSLIFFSLLIAWTYWMNRARRTKQEPPAVPTDARGGAHRKVWNVYNKGR